MNASSLHLQFVKIVLDGQPLLEVDQEISAGDILTVMGPSGSGKSSLLAYIAGFLDPAFSASGKVVMDGRDLTTMPASNRRTGILFQDPLLFPHMSVGGNLLFAIPGAVRGDERTERAKAALERIGLEGYYDRDPATLSGGQKARVALMRVLLSQPAALLLDEPFSKLDANRRDQMRALVFEEARQQQLPTILVTHDIADAEAADGHCINLDADQET